MPVTPDDQPLISAHRDSHSECAEFTQTSVVVACVQLDVSCIAHNDAHENNIDDNNNNKNSSNGHQIPSTSTASHFDWLPDELLTRILSYLSVVDRIRVERVSRRFGHAARCTWTRKTCRTLRIHQQQFPADDLSYLANPFSTIAIIKRAAAHVEHLQIGCIEERPVSPSSFIGRKSDLPTTVLRAISEYCVHMQSLVISKQVLAGIDCLAALTRLSTSLRHLSIVNCRLDACNESDGVSAELILRQLWLQLPHLVTFELVGRGSCYGYLKLWSSTFDLLPTGIQNLDISSGQSTMVADLLFVKRLTDLRRLSIERSDIDSESLSILASHCTRLEHLNVSYSRRLTNLAVIADMRQLRSLVLDGNRDHLDDDSLIEICRSCTHIQHLSLESCSRLTARGLQSIPDYLASKLDSLSLNGLNTLNENLLEQICKNCTNLRHLQIKFCKTLPESALMHLAALKHLRTLGVSGVQTFTNQVLYAILDNKQLDLLEAVNCDQLKLTLEHALLHIIT